MTWTDETAAAWATSMVPALAARAREAEDLRRLPVATIEDCEAVDAFALVTPERRGGHGLGVRALTDVARILSHGCMSTGWTVSFLMLHNWFVARGPAAMQDAVWGDKSNALIPCPLAPTGTATPVEGGYRITGRWSWATGVMHGDWVMVNTLVDRGEGHPPESRFCLAPVDDFEIDDVWHTSGMRGTGSNDVVAADLFVPEHLTMLAADLRGEVPPPGAALHPEPFISYPMTPVLVMVACSPALGGAEAAVQEFRRLAAERVMPYSLGERAVERPATQIRLAEALATVRSARLVWEDALERICDAYDDGGTLTPTERGSIRLAAAQVVKLSCEAVSTASIGLGASSSFLDSPMQRIQRDVETIKGHVVYDWDRAAQLAGKLELGLEPGPTDML